MGFIHLQPVGLRGSIAWPDAAKRMAEIAAATSTMVLGHPKVQSHDLVALAGPAVVHHVVDDQRP